MGVVVQKSGNNIFFDKRAQSQFDYLTVNETAHEPPVDDKDGKDGKVESINSPTNLSREATAINLRFSQQVLNKNTNESYSFDRPNPFEYLSQWSSGYKYRKWRLNEQVELVCRCEVDGVMREKDEDQFLTIKALNEYDPKTLNWKQKLDSQRGAVLATELKNNSAKLAKWTAQALLAGNHQIKLGYVSRVNARENFKHTILGTQSYKPKEFANQMNLQENNLWGILNYFFEMFLHYPDGKYVILRDPNKAILRIYEVPLDAFENADDGGSNSGSDSDGGSDSDYED